MKRSKKWENSLTAAVIPVLIGVVLGVTAGPWFGIGTFLFFSLFLAALLLGPGRQFHG